MLPKISIIIPVYNREKLIVRCLDSVKDQTVLPYELVVVDNNSTDSTRFVVEKWKSENSNLPISFKILNQSIRGAYAARQKGQENAEGDYFIFFDSDDAMRPNLIEEVLNKLSEHPDADVVCWQCMIHQLDKSSRVPPFMADKPLEAHLVHTLLRPQGYTIRKSFLEKTGGWNKQLFVWDDLELGQRILLKNPVIYPLKKILADIFSQEESITGLDFSSKQGEWEKILDEMANNAASLQTPDSIKINNIIDYRRVILAAHYKREKNLSAARNLYKKTIQKKSMKYRIPLIFAYHYTSLGLRGAWRIVRKVIM